MYFNPEGRTLYPASYEYNACRLIEALSKVVENHGGDIVNKHSYNHGFIVKRTITKAINDYSERVKALKNALETGKSKNPEITKKALTETERKLDELVNINNDPVEIFHGLTLSFAYDNIYYYISLNDNPFFDFYFVKTPIVSGDKISRDACMINLDKSEWLWDCFFEYRTCNDDLKEAANLIFNQVTNAKNSIIRRDSYKTRVLNRNNSGYHYETIYKPERFETITF